MISNQRREDIETLKSVREADKKHTLMIQEIVDRARSRHPNDYKNLTVGCIRAWSPQLKEKFISKFRV